MLLPLLQMMSGVIVIGITIMSLSTLIQENNAVDWWDVTNVGISAGFVALAAFFAVHLSNRFQHVWVSACIGVMK